MKEYLVTYAYRKEEHNCDDRDYISSRIYDIDNDIYTAESKRAIYNMFRYKENYVIINIIELGSVNYEDN